jgi:hypothetical protein
MNIYRGAVFLCVPMFYFETSEQNFRFRAYIENCQTNLLFIAVSLKAVRIEHYPRHIKKAVRVYSVH